MEEPIKTWQRREGESARAYRGLETYIAMNADRSLVKVGQKLGISKALVERWSSEHDWTIRCRDYDRHISELRLQRLSNAREKLIDEQVAIAAQMFALVKSRMRSLPRKQLNAIGLARLFYVASQAIQSVFGNERPLADAPPKIVVLNVKRNSVRDFEKEGWGDFSGMTDIDSNGAPGSNKTQ
jgi:hypothetical protein